MSNATSSALRADLAEAVAGPVIRYPNGKPLMELALEAWGEDGDTARELLLSRKLSSEAFIRLMRKHSLKPVPSGATIRKWIATSIEAGDA